MSTFEPSLFRAYDIRGVYPKHMNEAVAYAAGRAFVQVLGAKRVVVGRDVRASGASLLPELIRGITEGGADVIDIGVISTEMLYFAAGTLDCDGGMSITASHNPGEWNGIKLIGKDAKPLTREEKLGEIYEAMQAEFAPATSTGNVETQDLSEAYIAMVRAYLPEALPALSIVANVNFGANGKYVDALLRDTPVTLTRLNWNEDGTFPKGTPNPMLASNRKETCELIVSEGAAFGVAWDADADRCFVYDEKGRWFNGYYVTALLLRRLFAQETGAKAICERRLTWANIAEAEAQGAEIIFTRTGHGYFKAAMREHGAIFGGESSGHYYFRDFFYCDSGLITFAILLGLFAETLAAGEIISSLLDTFLEKFPTLPDEQNFITDRAAEIIEAAKTKYADAEQNHVDGLTVEYPEWRFNLRMSSNEPLMRLNMEARTPEELATRHAEIETFIASFGARKDDHV